MKLRFPHGEIPSLSAEYEAKLSPRDQKLTELIQRDVFPAYTQQGYLTKEEFLTVCAWKTPRSSKWCSENEDRVIKDVSSFSLATESESLRILLWTVLSGVDWPTASVFVHFAFPNRYPILDIRALWSLGIDKPSRYTFSFWVKYTDFCRNLANEAQVSLRVLDQALWRFSKNHQGKLTTPITC